MLNATEYALLINEMRMNDGDAPMYQDPYSYGEGTDWQSEVINPNAPIIEHQVSLSGGNNKGNYYLSFGYLYHEGIVEGTLTGLTTTDIALDSTTPIPFGMKRTERSCKH